METAEILGKAYFRAGAVLGISVPDLFEILGINVTLQDDTKLIALDPLSQEGQRALQLINIYKNLDTILGGDQEKIKLWFKAENFHLKGRSNKNKGWFI